MLTAVLTRGLERIGDALVTSLPAADGQSVRDPRDEVSQAGGQPVGREPVVLVGGFATTAPLLKPMTRWLEGAGYAVTGFAVGAGLDCAQHTVDQLTRQIQEVAEQAGQPVHLIGHSRGGQFARAAAVQSPDQVASLISLGTPFDLFGLRLHTLLAAAALAVAGTVGVNGCARWSCLAGDCCRAFRQLLRGPCPPGVAFTSIYSEGDGVVPARSSIDPAARNISVSGRHLDLLTGQNAHQAIAQALAATGGGPAERLLEPRRRPVGTRAGARTATQAAA